MADIKLDIAWDIEADGEIEIAVHPTSDPKLVLGKFTLGEDVILENLESDIREAERADSDAVLLEWEALAAFFEDMSEAINNRLNNYRQSQKDDLASLLEMLRARKAA